MKNFLIKLTKENQAEVKAWFDKNVPECGYSFDAYGLYYGIMHGNINYQIRRSPDSNIPIIKSMSELSELEEKTFPRYMMVGNEASEQLNKRLVLGKFNSRFVAVYAGYESDYEQGLGYETTTWRFAKEIEEPKVLELTIDEIAKKFDTKPELIKIKK